MPVAILIVVATAALVTANGSSSTGEAHQRET
jgi:hypothetical protein